jgi:TusA-related sulfurtransferase
MIITATTKISKIIKHDKKVIDVIASINKHFRKLKNPILCKMLASRVSVADAAKIGGVSTEAFLKKLQENGYTVQFNGGQTDESNSIGNTKVKNNSSNNKIMDKTNVVKLDARPILSGGVDPFDEIMKTLKSMKDDQTLLIINTFEPIPILNILKKRGYEYETERPEPGVVYTYLRKTEREPTTKEVTETKTGETDDFEIVQARFTGKMREIDVRDLEMPMPMVVTLEELEKLKEGEALYVHHKRLPQYLLPELENRGFKLVQKPVDEDNLKLIIYK